MTKDSEATILTVHCSLGLGVAFLGAFGATPALAQRRDPAQLLAAFVQERQSPTKVQYTAFDNLAHVLIHHADYPAADLESLLRGLEELALTGTPSRLRAGTASLLTIPGSAGAVHPIRGMFTRLERVYRQSADAVVRLVLIRSMGDQIDRREAAAFLEAVAARESSKFTTEPQSAIGALHHMGEEGRTVIMRLYYTGAVSDPEAKSTLEVLAKAIEFSEPPVPR